MTPPTESFVLLPIFPITISSPQSQNTLSPGIDSDHVLGNTCIDSTTCTAPVTNTVADHGTTTADASPIIIAPSSATDGHPVQHRMRTHLQDNILQSKQYTDGTIRYDLSKRRGFTVTTPATSEPRNYIEALNSESWRTAIHEEYMALRLVPARSGINVIDYKWVYKIKRK